MAKARSGKTPKKSGRGRVAPPVKSSVVWENEREYKRGDERRALPVKPQISPDDLTDVPIVISREPKAPAGPPVFSKNLGSIPKKKSRGRRLFRGILWTFAACALIGAVVLGTAWSAISRDADQYLPLFTHRVPPTQSKVFDINGNVIGILANQRRTVIPYGDIPKAFQGAIVAAEDAEFWKHSGVSYRGVFGAVYRGAKSFGKDRSGFSTLTMQLVRTVTEKRERNILKGAIARKLREIIIARHLEKAFNKQQIMEMYANEVNFGAGHYGIEAASQYYFRKSALELSIEESALLAAMVQSPSRSHNRLFSTDPKEREIVRTRRNYVLSRMANEGYLREGDAELLKERPIRLDRENASEVEFAAYVVEEIRKQLEPKYGMDMLMEGGLEIYTTIDSLWQQAATDVVQKRLREVDRNRGFRREAVRFYNNPDSDRDPSWQRFYEPGDTARGIILNWQDDIVVVRMDRTIIEVPSSAFAWAGEPALEVLTRGAAPLFAITETNPDGTPKSLELDQVPEVEGALLAITNTGEIRAMVGGYNFRRSQFNRATQAFRQVGSTMKAFVYGAALFEGYTPATLVDDTPTNFQYGMTSYQPRNFERNYWGPLTLWESLAHSRNVAAVKTLELAGINNAIKFAANCGITSHIPPYPSMALGATDLTLKEMARAYATIASGGYQCPEPFLIKKVVDREGRVLEEIKPAPRAEEPIIDPVVDFQLIQLLQGVTSSGTAGGTAAALGWPVAGKTGTTDDYTDAWFMGFSTRITCGVWIGLDTKRTIYRNATGGRIALPIWTDFMRVVLPTTPKEDFKPPQGLEWIDLDIDTGLRAGPATSPRRMRSLAFRPGTGPSGETDAESAARAREAREMAKFLAVEQRTWGLFPPKTDEPPPDRLFRIIDPNDY